jgi:translation initiation factor IF-1
MNKAMWIPDEIEVEVEVETVLTEATAMVKLPNGRVVFGYCGDQWAGLAQALEGGGRVLARLFVADFTRAELMRRLN